jgi:alanine racemase
VKADAYGHGAVPVARRLERESIDQLGVALVEEGLELRRAGIGIPIVVLGASMPAQISAMVEGSLTPTVYSMSTFSAILEASRRLSRPIPFHLKIDTGMGRLGLLPHELGEALDRIAALPRPTLGGALTTLAGSDQEESPRTAEQLRLFSSALEEMRRRGLKPQHTHIANSGGILNHPPTWLDMVRPGILLYGLRPAEAPPLGDLRPALSLRARILQIKSLPSGSPIGYGGSFVTARDSRVAIIAAGYDDGLNRLLHDAGEVLVRGRRARFAGRISMDFSAVDVTDVPGAAEGDEVTIIGSQGEEAITAWDVARQCRTIPYEILCGIGARVARVYSGEGAPRTVRSRFD